MSPAAIERKLAAIARYLPDIKRPLAQLSIIVEGKNLLLRQGDGLVEAGRAACASISRRWLTTTSRPASEGACTATEILAIAGHQASRLLEPAEMVQLAGHLEDEGQLAAAADMYRAAMVAGGPTAEVCFLLAELLYQLHDLPAARERYYMAIELDEDYVEARANLGCVLAELGEPELAIAAFEGALAFHDDYPDVHYHLAAGAGRSRPIGRGGRALAGVFAAVAQQPLGGRSPRAAGLPGDFAINSSGAFVF